MKVKFPVKFILFLRFQPIWSFEAAHLLSYESCEFDGPVVPIRRAECLNSYGQAVFRKSGRETSAWEIGVVRQSGPEDMFSVGSLFTIDSHTSFCPRTVIVFDRRRCGLRAHYYVPVFEELVPGSSKFFSPEVVSDPVAMEHHGRASINSFGSSIFWI